MRFPTPQIAGKRHMQAFGPVQNLLFILAKTRMKLIEIILVLLSAVLVARL